MIYEFLLKHEKAVVCLLIFSVLVSAIVFYRSESLRYKKALETVQIELIAKTSQLDALAREHSTQESKLKEAEAKIIVIGAQEKTKIVTIKQQVVPKDCKQAIDFAIEKKGDLAW